MALSIEMTIRGVLLAGHWKTAEELDNISSENKRNTLIVILANTCTNQSVAYFQGFNDEKLIGKAAIWILLKELGFLTGPDSSEKTDDNQRNLLITLLNSRTDTPVPVLQGRNDLQLVTTGLEWFNKSKTVTGILEFSWVIDAAKVVSTTPDLIAEQVFSNPSPEPMDDSFTIEKVIESSSEFSHDHSFEFQMGVSTQFKAGIPFFAENKTAVDVTTGTKNTWSMGETNTTTQKYSHKVEIVVPPRSTIKRSAAVTKGMLDVPYRAKIRTAVGTEIWTEGIWSGVSTWNLVSKQETVTSEASTAQKPLEEHLEGVPPLVDA